MTKKSLIEFLENRGIYEEVDQKLIDELFFNYEILKKAKREIRDGEIMVRPSKDPDNDYRQKNPAFGIYNDALHHVMSISKRLGLSPRDRSELKINMEVEGKDGF